MTTVLPTYGPTGPARPPVRVSKAIAVAERVPFITLAERGKSMQKEMKKRHPRDSPGNNRADAG
jgi:hypothetical protein